jgi:photosystem II stability/assembly factor-like uncharacterized protein
MTRRLAIIAALGSLAACAHPKSVPPPLPVVRIPKTADFGALTWRWIGPAQMGGRLDAVAGIPDNPNVIYAAHSSGGLYKSTDAGESFTPIFKHGTSSAIGAIAVAPSHPDVLYLGTGEGFPRNTASAGDGVFKSINAGKTWAFAGLRDSRHVAKIAIDPSNPDVVLAAVLGHEFQRGGERGIYRTQDGGKTWQRVLYVNPTTGGSDVVFDPQDPNVAYAGTFDFLREPWHFRGGGIGSGLFKSTDGGRTWRRLTDPALHDGLPGGIINRVGIAVCYAHPNVVYAIVPTKHSTLFRSDDAGAHWRLVNASPDLDFRPFYFSQVRVDPRDPNRVYIISGENQVSKDGGRTFRRFGGGGDNHDLWIDPTNSQRMLGASDMGLNITVNGGTTWNYDDVVPFAQVYRVGYDLDVPYHVMGGLQDHEVWWGPSTLWNAGEYAGVPGGAWRNLVDWGDGAYALADPRDPNLIYLDTHFGDLALRNMRTGEIRNISPQPVIAFGTGASSYRYRFNWTAPVYISPHDPNVVYFGGNVLFKTSDGGSTWRIVSPDLSEPCSANMLSPSGGPISRDDTNAETYCTIYAISEDAADPATLWAGTDNGNLWITRDGGAHWTNVTGNVPHLPPAAEVSSIHASRTAAGVAYVSFDRHELGDDAPYVYSTTDYGRTWTDISKGLPTYVHVIREDPRNEQLLFAGTEQGVSVSFDRGRHWTSLMLGLAPVPVYDLRLQPVFNDLIIGTHGRGFYILDDITPLEGLAQTKGPALFKPVDAWRFEPRPTYEPGRGAFVADNKPYGALISYYLPLRAKKAKPPKVTLQILGGNGSVVRTLDATTKPGINRVVWDLTADPPGAQKAVQDPRPYYVFYPLEISGPEVLPGSYTVRLTVGKGQRFEQPVTVRLDTAAHATTDALQAQYDALEALARMQERGEIAVNIISGLDKQITQRLRRAKTATLKTRLDGYKARIDAAADDLRNGNGSQNAGYRNPAKLIDQIAYLRYLIPSYLGPPTQVEQTLIKNYERQTNAITSRAHSLFTIQLARVNIALERAKLPTLRAVITRTEKHRARSAPD